MVRWVILAYIGEPGGYGKGINRPVFYSDTAAPAIARIVTNATPTVRKMIKDVASNSKTVKQSLLTKHVDRRLERLLDMIEEK